MTRLSTLCKNPVATITPGTTIQKAAEQMRKEHVGALVVVEPDATHLRPVGIVTDRDVAVGVVALGLDPKVFLVEDMLGRPLITARVDQSARDALKIMEDKGIRRLPIVDKAGDLAGMVALDDILSSLVRDIEQVPRIVNRELASELRLKPRKQ
jgi:CBS domain-containing protein